MRFLILLLALCGSLEAAQPYAVSHYLPSTSPYYSSNIATNVPLANPAVGGAMATNALPTNGANTALWSTPLAVAAQDNLTLQLTWGSPGASPTTNQFYLYPMPDGVNVDTNHPAWSSGLETNSGTNIQVAYIPITAIGTTGYFQLGATNSGTNTCTNFDGQVFLKTHAVTVQTP